MPKSTEKASATPTVPMTPMRRLWCTFQGLRPSRPLASRKRNRGSLQSAEQSNTATPDFPSTSDQNAARIVESSSDFSIAAPDERGDANGDGLGSVQQINTPAKQRPDVESTEARARVAIQQSDSPFDAVVITTLPCYPFHCHEDLIKMSRPELVATANLFNAHLPGVMQIEASETVSDARIRRAIETLVGIIPTTPRAPKASRKINCDDKPPQANFSPPSSPLAMRVSRRRGQTSSKRGMVGQLGRLDEVDEPDLFTDHRPLKRRKVSDVLATPTLFEQQVMITDNHSGGRNLPRSGSISSPLTNSARTGLSPDLGLIVVS